MKNASIGLIDAALGYMAKDEEVEAVAEEKQVEIIEASDELKKSVTDFLKNDRATVIELAKTKYKIADPEPLMDKFVELINKWEELYKPIQGDRDAMSQMLWDEVMSKVDVATLGN
jgi:archaellum biogenesis ATPase FlaH